MIIHMILFLSSCSGQSISVQIDEAYQQDKNEGYIEGRSDAYDAAYQSGYQQGRANGYEAGADSGYSPCGRCHP